MKKITQIHTDKIRDISRIALFLMRPPVAEVGKAPMITVRCTGHRTYIDGRYGPKYSQRRWAMGMKLGRASVGQRLLYKR